MAIYLANIDNVAATQSSPRRFDPQLGNEAINENVKMRPTALRMEFDYPNEGHRFPEPPTNVHAKLAPATKEKLQLAPLDVGRVEREGEKSIEPVTFRSLRNCAPIAPYFEPPAVVASPTLTIKPKHFFDAVRRFTTQTPQTTATL